MLEVSIIIVNWNARDLLRDCLHSVIERTQKAHEIIVVDNASGDSSVTMVRTEFPNVTLIENNINAGFAAANNQGLRRAGGRYVLLLNPDTVILDNAIDTMIDWCDGQSNIGCAGCQVLESETVIQKTCFSDPSLPNLLLLETGLHRWFPHSEFFGKPQYSGWDRRSERDVHVVSGMFMLIPKAVLDKVGLLDEAFFVYAEEADMCRRIRNSGWRCTFTPIARIIHFDGGGKSTAQIPVRMRAQLQKSLLIYLRKHDGRITELLAGFVLSTSKLARLTLFGVLGMVSRKATFRRRADEAYRVLMFQWFGLDTKG